MRCRLLRQHLGCHAHTDPLAVSGYKYPDRGIIPDFPFTRTIEDLIADKDTEMEYVLALTHRQRD